MNAKSPLKAKRLVFKEVPTTTLVKQMDASHNGNNSSKRYSEMVSCPPNY
jgi:hypothetical protein